MTRLLAACLAVAFASFATAQAPVRPHTIQGRVTSDSGGPINRADVIVTIAPSAEVVTGATDAAGAYRITIANATGEYILNISALGFRPFRQRVTIRAGDSVATSGSGDGVGGGGSALSQPARNRTAPTRSAAIRMTHSPGRR